MPWWHWRGGRCRRIQETMSMGYWKSWIRILRIRLCPIIGCLLGKCLRAGEDIIRSTGNLDVMKEAVSSGDDELPSWVPDLREFPARNRMGPKTSGNRETIVSFEGRKLCCKGVKVDTVDSFGLK